MSFATYENVICHSNKYKVERGDKIAKIPPRQTYETRIEGHEKPNESNSSIYEWLISMPIQVFLFLLEARILSQMIT